MMDVQPSEPSTLRRRASNLSRRTPSFIHVEDDDENDSKIAKTIRRMDMYARVNDDLTVKTESGATVSVVFWLLLLILVSAELYTFIRERDSREETMRVDTSIGNKLEIRLNMTFHAINCLDLHVDAMDVAGDNQMDVEHAMLKQRLTADGKPISVAISEEVSLLEHRATLPRDYCGSCYGNDERGKAAAKMEALHGWELPCCNTCHDVVESYALRGWSTIQIRKTAEQCVRESHLSEPIQKNEGCNLSGMMRVNKVAGNFHMAMGDSMVKEGRHVHVFNVDDSDSFNISHTIHSMSFGDTYPDMPMNPLDNIQRILDEETGTGLMQYYINLVPTIYKEQSKTGEKTELITTQFTYTMKFRSVYGYDDYQRHEHHSQPDHHHAIGEHVESRDVEEDIPKKKKEITNYLLPGVFFVYDMAPFMLEVEVSRQPISHFLIRLCAVVGGVYTVSGMLDQFIYHVIGRMKGSGLLPS